MNLLIYLFLFIICFQCSIANADNKSIYKSVVTIYSKNAAGGSGQGTGFIISNSGEIATAYHVVQESTSLTIYDYNNVEYNKIRIKFIDGEKDIAILSIDNAQLPSLNLDAAEPPNPIHIKIVGSPRGIPQQTLFGHTTSQGYISSLQLPDDKGRQLFEKKIDVLPLDVTVYSGMSGAPVINDAENVIGILSGSYAENRGIAWAIPIYYTRNALANSTNSKELNYITWEKLSLYSSKWNPLKRSYSKQYSPEHIAKLEILEGLIRDYKGNYRATESNQEIKYDDSLLGRCVAYTEKKSYLNLNYIDNDQSQIVGDVQIDTTTRSDYTQPNWVPSPEVAVLNRKLCNERVFKDREKTSDSIKKRGIQYIYINSVHIKSDQYPGVTLYTDTNITDCEGSNCSSTFYGMSHTGQIEIISNNKLRWSSLIYTKSQ